MQLNRRRLAAAAGCVVTLAGAGLATAGATAAFAAAATTSSYSCHLSGIIPLTEAGALTLTTPRFGVLSRTVTVQITQPMSTTKSPVAITSVTIGGTASVSGDGATTTLPFSGMSGPSAAGAAPPAVPTTEALKLLSPHSGPVTVTLPQSYTLSINLGFGTETGTCTTTSPGSETIAVGLLSVVTQIDAREPGGRALSLSVPAYPAGLYIRHLYGIPAEMPLLRLGWKPRVSPYAGRVVAHLAEDRGLTETYVLTSGVPAAVVGIRSAGNYTFLGQRGRPARLPMWLPTTCHAS